MTAESVKKAGRAITLTQITATTGAITALVNLVVILGLWDATLDQLAQVNVFLVAVGGMIHAWRNPSLPGGPDLPAEVDPPTG